MNKPNVLIVEDEVLVSLDIGERLKKAGFHITAMVETGEQALDHLQTNFPDLVLLDICLDGKLDGIETAEKINTKYTLPIVYLTSLTDQTTFRKAQQTKPSAYIQKPFNEIELIRAIELAISNHSHFSHSNDETKASKEEVYYILNDSIFLKHRTRFEKVSLSSIVFLEADGNCTYIHTATRKFFLSTTMGSILENLHIPNIIRTHRSYAVNLNMISSYEGNMLFIDKIEIPVSRSHREDVFNRFKTI